MFSFRSAQKQDDATKMMPTSRFTFGPPSACIVRLGLHSSAHAQDEEIPRLERNCPTDAGQLEATCYTFMARKLGRPSGRTTAAGGGSRMVPAKTSRLSSSPAVPVLLLGNQAYIEQLLKDVGERTLVTMDNRGFVHAEPSLACQPTPLSLPITTSSTLSTDRFGRSEVR